MSKQLNKYDLSAAAKLLRYLEPAATRDTQFVFQVFDDTKRKDASLAQTFISTIRECKDKLIAANEKGCGVYVTINRTKPGKPRRAENVIAVRKHFVEIDGGVSLDEIKAWDLQPALVNELSRGKFHVYFNIAADVVADVVGFKARQQRLAVKYKGGIESVDLPRVLRLPGFYHRKGKPFAVRCVYQNADAPAYTLADFEQALQDIMVAATSGAPTSQEPMIEWDKPDNVAWAVHYLENDSPTAIEGRGGELTTLKIAAILKDHAISEDKVLELMLDHWNERLIDPPQPPWECEELKVKVHNAFSYATGNAPGADTAEAEFSDMTEEEKQSYLKDDAEFRKTHGAEYTAKKKIAKRALEERIWTFSELCEEWVYITQMDRFVCRVDHDMIVKPEVFAKRFAYAKLSKSPITTTMFSRKKNTIRRLDKAVFAPGAGEFVGRALNFYTQPDIAPAEGDTALWDSHLEYLLPNKIDRDHLLNWCAWLLQNIDKKPKHALLVAGHTQGTGKSYIAEVMARILGIANVNPIGALELSSSFNRWALNSKLLIVEELRAIDKREVAHKLHPIVTQELIPINDKGVATFKIENCFGILAMTNDDAAISLDNSDRRYLVIRTEAMPRPVNYYGRLYGTLKDDKFIAAVAWQLIHRDLKGYDGQQRAPETEAKRDMIAAGRGEFEAWLDAESDNSPFNRDLVSINDDVFSVVPKRLERGASVMTRTIATFLKHQLNGKSFEDRHWLSDGRKVRLWALHGTYDELVKLSPAERAKLYETQRSVARASDATNTATEDFEP